MNPLEETQDIIDEQVRQLIDIGVIEPSELAWHSPLVVVQKKDGKPRLCTDFRTPMGVHQYRRVPFGLVGAPW